MPVETKCAWCGAILLDADHAAAHVVNKCDKSPSKKLADALEAARVELGWHDKCAACDPEPRLQKVGTYETLKIIDAALRAVGRIP